MRALYHLTPAETWNTAPEDPFTAASLESEGFIHCSYREQVLRVANTFYADVQSMIALEIDPDRLSARVVDEDSGTGELFPHVYGPIDRAAIVAVVRLIRDTAGKWCWPVR
jgi:uncharacterized protein (DUF952 family)